MAWNSSSNKSLNNAQAKTLGPGAPVAQNPGFAGKPYRDSWDVERAYRELPNAERRVRVYSNQGFVPTRHGHRCDIQFVQVDRYGDEWVWTVQWGSAKRSYGHGSLVVVR